MTGTVSPVSQRRPVGRPPRISRAAIAEAAADIGLDDLTLKAVAERLGVSVPGLYHHVRGRDDLLRLAAEHSVRQHRVPVDHGQHWALWLLEWARHNRESFRGEPALLAQYVEGAISTEVIVDNAETILAVLCRQGFGVVEAQTAYELVSSCAIGFAVSDLRRRRAEDDGHPLLGEPGDDHPFVRSLLAAGREPDFDAEITTVLRGIAAERGERWTTVARHLAG